MTKHLHLDLVGGIAGDMTVAALVESCVPWESLAAALADTGLPFTDLQLTRDTRHGISGARFVVTEEQSPPTRHWREIRQMIEGARLTERARHRALDIFERLALAEAYVHGCEPDEVHFHEVGAMDSIADVVATAVALDLSEITTASCGTVPICTGTTHTKHGTLPLPAPATARLLNGFTITSIPGTLETVTPTGAAILASLCTESGHSPPMRLLGTGMGLGSASLEDRPNALRVLVGERVEAEQNAPPEAVVIEAAIDDMDPRIYGEVAANLFAAGALDVCLIPLQMKKQRPGTLLQVVCRPALEGVLTGLILRETTTLGVRSHDVRRVELERHHRPIETRFGTLRLKCGVLGGEIVNVSPEYDDCLALAHEHGVPVKDVISAAAMAAADMTPAYTPNDGHDRGLQDAPS
jgi:pyridinium-3,5-bisthiocarboxylic acid mononucleotide nickel chelatase